MEHTTLFPAPVTPLDGTGPDPLVHAYVGPDGDLEMIHVERTGERPTYAYHRYATDGTRTLKATSGSFQVKPWQSLGERVMAIAAQRPDSWSAPCDVPECRRVLASSSAWAGRAGEARSRFAEACGETTLRLAAVGADVGYLDAWDESHGRQAVERVLRRLPLIAGAFLEASRPDAGEGLRAACDRLLDGGIGLDEACALLEPSLRSTYARMQQDAPGLQGIPYPGTSTPTHLRLALRRLGGIDVNPQRAMVALCLCHLAPRDWAPSTGNAVDAMADVLEMAARLGPAPGTCSFGDLLAGVAGDWVSTRDALAAAGAGDPKQFADGCRDMAMAYGRQVLGPAIENLARRRMTKPEMPEGAAHRELFGGKGILSVAKASRDWHRHAPYINGIVASSLGAIRVQSWPRPFPDFVASNGYVLVPLLSVAELVEEGARQNHCIGSYGARVSTGKAIALSVRSPDGTPSTTLLVAAGRVVEHRSYGNGRPGERETEAAAELVAWMPDIQSGQTEGRLALRSWMSAAAGWALAATAPRWGKRVDYNPHLTSNVLKAVGAWGGNVPRRARGSLEAIVARECPGLVEPSPGSVGTGSSIEAWLRSVWWATLMPARVVQKLVFSGPMLIGAVVALPVSMVFAFLMVSHEFSVRAQWDKEVEESVVPVREWAEGVIAAQDAYRDRIACGERAPFKPSCPLRTPIPGRTPAEIR